MLEKFVQNRRASTMKLVRKDSLETDHVARPDWCANGERRVLVRGMFYDPSVAWLMEMERVEREQMDRNTNEMHNEKAVTKKNFIC